MELFKTPYRLFFFLGTLGLFAGLMVWVLFGFYSNEYYLGRMHAHYMIGIFLLSFVIGFLMTAIPRMTGSPGSTGKELLLQLLPMLSAFIWGIFETREQFFFISLALALIVLFTFCFRRIITASHMLPDVFPFVIIGLLSGFIGTLLLIFGFADIGGRLFYLNMVLSLCVGVGARLIPMILGLGCAKSYGVKEMWAVGLLLIIVCFIESFGYEKYGSFLRFSLLLLVYFRYWNAHQFSKFNSSVSWGIRAASFSIVLGTLGLWLFPDYRLEGLHVLYISGFGLLTLMVASRVILSHGNFDLSLEFRNRFIQIPIMLITLAAMTRVSASFIEDGYERHLGYAALMFIIASALWSVYFIPKLMKERI